MESKLTKNQKKIYNWCLFEENGASYRIRATVRYDDECGNGHNSFSVTADIEEKRGNQWRFSGGGCCHDEIARHFPELAPYLKWHFMSSDGPMHYLQNTIFLAGVRDCWGKLKGEPRSWDTVLYFEGFPMPFEKYKGNFLKYLASLSQEQKEDEEVVRVEYKKEKNGYQYPPKYTLRGYPCEWYQCPFGSMEEAGGFLEALQDFTLFFDRIPTAFGEGKERELDAARSAAMWPEATDEELCTEPEVLKAKLLERLPALIEEFRKDVETLGLVF